MSGKNFELLKKKSSSNLKLLIIARRRFKTYVMMIMTLVFILQRQAQGGFLPHIFS
jgi:hypothetical protein